MKVKITIVTLKEPCSACLILNNLVKEIIAKLQKKFDNLDIQYVEFSNLARIHEIEGLEVEKFPAIIVNGEQVTAGELPDINYLISAIEWGSQQHE
ncbi:MAG: thioredoxin family protein [Tepidanaerobacteraceae bacterium]|jgi:hypothetical protein